MLATIIRLYRGEAMQLRGKGFQTLARAIVGQQISVKASTAFGDGLRKAVVRVNPKRMAYAPYGSCATLGPVQREGPAYEPDR